MIDGCRLAPIQAMHTYSTYLLMTKAATEGSHAAMTHALNDTGRYMRLCRTVLVLAMLI